jgi:ribosomal protein L37AE/L43A
MTAPSRSAELVRCRNCGRRNRVPAAAAGIPRCGNCHQPLPWIGARRSGAAPAADLRAWVESAIGP